MDDSSKKTTAFGLSGEKIARLLSIGREDDLSDAERKDEYVADLRIEGYEIIEKVAEAGQGQVWRALQQSTGREVAIKVPRIGSVASERARIRFEREIELAARLKHPNIARIYDSGVDRGQHYYVMDFVEGLNLDDYVRKHDLTHRQILELMRTICQAVQHAHQNGVIHRDLKPSNIIVAEDGRPFIVDFGLAKAILENEQGPTISMDGETVGTPAYMSPEQADGRVDEVDTRTDIYSLGIILYNLLTGESPHDLSGSRQQVLRRIADGQVKRPRTVCRGMDRDLETLLLKTLDRNPERRYSTASSLADDIKNYLDGAPLIAGPPSTTYRLKKFVRRNAALSSAILTAVLTLIVGLIATMAMYIEADHARAESERQAKISETVSSFLRHDLLASVEPERGRGRDVTVRSMLDTASENLAKFKNEPLVEAPLRHTIGWTYRELGELKAARPHLERAVKLYREQFGEGHENTLHSVRRLALLYWSQGRYKEAAKLLEKALPISQRELGSEHITTLGITQGLAMEYIEMGRYEEAEQFCLEGISTAQNMSGEKNEWSLHLVGGLGLTYECQGRYEKAEHEFLKVLRLRDGFWDDENINTLLYKGLLARVYRKQKRYDEAESLYLEILPIQRKVDGDETWRTLRAVRELAWVYTHLGKHHEAEELFAEALEVYQRIYGKEHGDTIRCMNGLGELYMAQGRFEEAKSLLIEVLEISRRTLGEDHPWTLTTMNNLAAVYRRQAQYEQAEQLLLEAVKGRRLKLGDTHPHTIESLKNLIDLYEAWKKPEKADQRRAKLPNEYGRTEP